MKNKIGIVTVLYNSESVLEEFFETLNIQTYKNFILYVVDNASPDNSLFLCEKLSQKYDLETVIIKNNTNYGVAKGNNIGIERALGDNCNYILLSNNDVALESQTIEKLLEGLEKSNAEMAVPKIYFYNTNKIWAAGGGYKIRNGLTIQYGMGEEDNGQHNDIIEVSYAPTCFMLIKKEVFDVVGLMDENYFVYYDDTDFVYRATQFNNQKLFYIPDSRLYHNESTSTGKMSDFSVKYLWRNLFYFSLKNYGAFYGKYVVIYNILYINIILYFKYSLKQWRIAKNAYKEGVQLFKKYKKDNITTI